MQLIHTEIIIAVLYLLQGSIDSSVGVLSYFISLQRVAVHPLVIMEPFSPFRALRASSIFC